MPIQYAKPGSRQRSLLRRALLIVPLLAGIAAAAMPAMAQGQGDATVVDLATRPGVTVRTMTLVPPGRASFAAILLVGGNGVNNIPAHANAAWTRDGSFLVRSSPLFRDHGVYTVLVEVPNPTHPYGVRGVGEVPIIPPVAAVGNAVARATGLRLVDLPLSPPKISEALDSAAPRMAAE